MMDRQCLSENMCLITHIIINICFVEETGVKYYKFNRIEYSVLLCTNENSSSIILYNYNVSYLMTLILRKVIFSSLTKKHKVPLYRLNYGHVIFFCKNLINLLPETICIAKLCFHWTLLCDIESNSMVKLLIMIIISLNIYLYLYLFDIKNYKQNIYAVNSDNVWIYYIFEKPVKAILTIKHYILLKNIVPKSDEIIILLKKFLFYKTKLSIFMLFRISCRELYLVYTTLIYLQDMFLHSSDLDSIISQINFETEVYHNCIFIYRFEVKLAECNLKSIILNFASLIYVNKDNIDQHTTLKAIFYIQLLTSLYNLYSSYNLLTTHCIVKLIARQLLLTLCIIIYDYKVDEFKYFIMILICLYTNVLHKFLYNTLYRICLTFNTDYG